MISIIEEQRSNYRIINETGSSTYIPCGTDWTLLGWDSRRFCVQFGNGQIGIFSESGSRLATTYLIPATNQIRNWVNGWLYFRDTQLGINYRLDIEAGTRINMG